MIEIPSILGNSLRSVRSLPTKALRKAEKEERPLRRLTFQGFLQSDRSQVISLSATYVFVLDFTVLFEKAYFTTSR